MDIPVGRSVRWRGGGHLSVDVANRLVLACTGGAASDGKPVPFDPVREELTCAPCRKFWGRVMKTENA